MSTANSKHYLDRDENMDSLPFIIKKQRVQSDTPLSKDAAEFSALIDAIKPILIQYIHDCESDTNIQISHTEAHTPRQLMMYMGKLLELPAQPRPEQLLPLIDKTLECSVKTWSPRFMDKLYAGTRPIGPISEMLIGILNTNVHVFHVSPVLTVMERNLILKLGRLMGYDGSHGGFLAPGGSYSNLHAVVTAKNFMFPELMKTGSQSGTHLVVFCTQHSHYSITHAILTTGIGVFSVSILKQLNR